MNEERRQTIVREIEHWQRSKLLPDQYCDFLLNLYLEDKAEHAPAGWGGKAVNIAIRSSGKMWFATFGLFSLICLVVLYFNVFHPLLQTGLTLLAVCALLYFGLRYRPASEAGGLALIGTGMLLLLGTGLYMLQLHQVGGWGWNAAFLAGCALFWIAFGIGARISVLHFCGWAALALVYALLLTKLGKGGPRWYEVQLYWVPVAFVFGWFSWFVHRWSKPASGVLFVTGALLWFMPEIHTAVMLKDQGWLQLQLIAKIATGGAAMFVLRSKWTAWVA